jgi:hypothetical protein
VLNAFYETAFKAVSGIAAKTKSIRFLSPTGDVPHRGTQKTMESFSGETVLYNPILYHSTFQAVL